MLMGSVGLPAQPQQGPLLGTAQAAPGYGECPSVPMILCLLPSLLGCAHASAHPWGAWSHTGWDQYTHVAQASEDETSDMVTEWLHKLTTQKSSDTSGLADMCAFCWREPTRA